MRVCYGGLMMSIRVFVRVFSLVPAFIHHYSFLAQLRDLLHLLLISGYVLSIYSYKNAAWTARSGPHWRFVSYLFQFQFHTCLFLFRSLYVPFSSLVCLPSKKNLIPIDIEPPLPSSAVVLAIYITPPPYSLLSCYLLLS